MQVKKDLYPIDFIFSSITAVFIIFLYDSKEYDLLMSPEPNTFNEPVLASNVQFAFSPQLPDFN